jgi:hypothetical protein
VVEEFGGEDVSLAPARRLENAASEPQCVRKSSKLSSRLIVHRSSIKDKLHKCRKLSPIRKQSVSGCLKCPQVEGIDDGSNKLFISSAFLTIPQFVERADKFVSGHVLHVYMKMNGCAQESYQISWTVPSLPWTACVKNGDTAAIFVSKRCLLSRLCYRESPPPVPESER